MIPLNIEDSTVLRRTLEELEASIIVLGTPITPIDKLPLAATSDEVIAKINSVIVGLNATITILNNTNTSDRQ